VPVVGTTTIGPGQSSYVLIEAGMHEGMGGPHLFEITLETDSPVTPVHKLYYRAFFGDPSSGDSKLRQ
jgi:hypothetical protein